VTAQEKLKREIHVLGLTIAPNASTLATKPMSPSDRDSLQRQMATRVAHLRLLQQRLDRLTK
jgi:hypothetical protein